MNQKAKERPTSHERIRKFNTRETYPEQNLNNDLCQAVVARGRLVFLRGQCPQSLDTAESIASSNPAVQTHKVMRNIKKLVKEAGGLSRDIVKLSVYLTDIRHREAVYRVIGRHLKGVYPVSTGLVVQALARPEWLVEVEAIAVIPDVQEDEQSDAAAEDENAADGKAAEEKAADKSAAADGDAADAEA